MWHRHQIIKASALTVDPVCGSGDNLLTSVNVARESGLVQRVQTILRVDVDLVPSSVHAAQHLSITYSSPETERTQTFLVGGTQTLEGRVALCDPFIGRTGNVDVFCRILLVSVDVFLPFYRL